MENRRSSGPVISDTLPERWAVTGVAGFIGSHLLEALLRADRRVVGLDNLSTGSQRKLEEVRASVTPEQWRNFRFLEGDVRSPEVCAKACEGAETVLHQAALSSVPRSLNHPAEVADVNVSGFVNVAYAAAGAGVERLVYASSSSVYGTSGRLRIETDLGCVLSPYAASKQATECFAASCTHTLEMSLVGLRYFNVFGPRQNFGGVYTSVVPRWISALLRSEQPVLYGDGGRERDFTFVEDVVLANMLASDPTVPSAVVNVGTGRPTSLEELFRCLCAAVTEVEDIPVPVAPAQAPERLGDAACSYASLQRAEDLLAYQPSVELEEGLRRTVDWFVRNPLLQQALDSPAMT
jgi:UDP-N-acetylglucosamine/UDP-N-acetyl-alpha-D-glucosaminouronate 4-epimerase